ncbi:hypothetical protein ACFX13_022247 [Malus domestica]|nr:pentatricopeptide repeat-containing protein At1g74850, chloroplastic-like [Malus domestica]
MQELFPELFRKNKLVAFVDVHRMWQGGAYTAMSVWLNNMYEMFLNGEDLPHLATVVVLREKMEKSSISQELPIAKAAYTFLQDSMPASFSFPKWNNGRILCQRPQLKRILSSIEPSTEGSERNNITTLSNSPFPPPGTKTSSSAVNSGRHNDASFDERIRTRPEFLTSTV